MIKTASNKINRFDQGEDTELERRIVNFLHLRLPDVSTIKVEAHHGTAILHGTVPSSSVQCRCLDCCRHVAGVLNVIDRLSV
jgi:osmotically-inducible protein OsmY